MLLFYLTIEFLWFPTIPLETIILNPSSTFKSAKVVSSFGMIRKNPDVGFGVVGTNRW